MNKKLYDAVLLTLVPIVREGLKEGLKEGVKDEIILLFRYECPAYINFLSASVSRFLC